MSADNKPLTIAVVGATGAVGEVALELIAKRLGKGVTVHALASEQSVGREVSFGRRSLVVDDLAHYDFKDCDFAIFSAGSEVSAEHAPRAAKAGAVVIDNTSYFRKDSNIPLVVPEVNGDVLADFTDGIIANPNCSTIQMVVALAPIHRAFGIRSVVVSTYQSVSGAGKAAMEELGRQSMDRFNFKSPEPKVFSHPIAFNVIPMIDGLEDNGFTKEEMKMHNETRRLLNDDRITVNATAVRVPVFTGHSEAVYVETDSAIDIDKVKSLLQQAPGVAFMDEGGVATPLTHAVDQDAVWISRLRPALNQPNGLHLWIVADNLRKGAALNAVQIVEYLIAQRQAKNATHH